MSGVCVEGGSHSEAEWRQVYNNYTSILVMLTRLRQAANHPHLVTKHNGYALLDDADAKATDGEKDVILPSAAIFLASRRQIALFVALLPGSELPKKIADRLEPLRETFAGVSPSIGIADQIVVLLHLASLIKTLAES